MEKKYFENVPAISESQVLTEEMMSQVESGSACEGGCKKTCITGMDGSYGGDGTKETVEKIADDAVEIAKEILD